MTCVVVVVVVVVVWLLWCARCGDHTAPRHQWLTAAVCEMPMR